MIKNVKRYIRSHKILLLIFVLSTIMSILTIIMPYFNSVFIDTLTLGCKYEDVVKLSVILVFSGICLSILQIYLNYEISIIKFKLKFEETLKVLNHIQKIPFMEFKKYNSVYLHNRISTDVNVIIEFTINNISSVIFEIVKLVIIMLVVLGIDRNVFTVCIIFIPIYILSYWYFGSKLFESGLKFKEESNTFQTKVYEQISNVKNIKIENSFEMQHNLLKRKFSELLMFFTEYIGNSTAFNSIDAIISTIFQSIIIVYGSIGVMKKTISIGEFSVLLSYFAMVIKCINYYLGLGKSFQDAKNSFLRIKEFIDIPLEQNGEINMENIEQINLQEVSFSYPDKTIFNDMNISFPKGYCTIIKGKNGIGKTTLSDLVIGIVKPNEGAVLYNCIDLEKINQYNLRKDLIAFLDQETYRVNMTVSEFLDIEKYEKFIEIWEGFKTLDIKLDNSIIEAISQNFNNKLSNLSAGEYQKVKIFKILSKKFDVIIMDEPTTYLDDDTKRSLATIINTFIMKEKIVICITHDMDFVRKINKTIVCEIKDI